MTITHVYAGDITKTETTADGDLLVYGKATGPDLDLDEQRCDPDWLKSAMPGWAQWANIREQHSAIAAGVGIETVQDGDDWYVKSLVVDAGSKQKVEKGVLKGYSIGIKNARVVKDKSAPGGRIVAGEIVEISLVDRPCNPTATMAIAKSADGTLAPVDVAGELVMDLTKAVIVDQDPAGGAAKSAVAFDRDEAVDLVKQVLDGTVTGAVLTKGGGGYDESADIAGAKDVIARIAALIQSEAAELAKGRLEEACDIGILLDANRAMAYFLSREQDQAGRGITEPTGDDDALTYVGLSPAAETAKHGKRKKKAKADGTNSNKSAIVVGGQAAEPDSDLVKAMAASEERIAALEADLAKAKAQPVQGGPAIMRVTATATPQSTKTAPDAEHYRRLAQTVDDQRARNGYLQLAEQAEMSAKAAGQ